MTHLEGKACPSGTTVHALSDSICAALGTPRAGVAVGTSVFLLHLYCSLVNAGLVGVRGSTEAGVPTLALGCISCMKCDDPAFLQRRRQHLSLQMRAVVC